MSVFDEHGVIKLADHYTVSTLPSEHSLVLLFTTLIINSLIYYRFLHSNLQENRLKLIKGLFQKSNKW